MCMKGREGSLVLFIVAFTVDDVITSRNTAKSLACSFLFLRSEVY